MLLLLIQIVYFATMTKTTTMLIILALGYFFIALASSQETMANATCDEEMTACRCPSLEEAQVCRFELTVQHLITFARYKVNAPPGSQGKVYFINSTGQLEHIPLRPNFDSCEDINCTEANTVDGRTFRAFFAINGRIPAPTLIFHENQTIVADVYNLLHAEAISIHWHGMHQRNTPWMDGLGFITQCPISPGASFRYIFRAYPPGTFWYHSHSGAQRTDGMYGGMIVLEGSNTTQEDIGIDFEDLPDQHTITFLDWQREESLDLFAKVHSKIRYFPSPDRPDDIVPTDASPFYQPSRAADGSGIGIIHYFSGLINGRGRHSSVPLTRSLLSILEVDEGKSYRFRLIGAQSVYAYNFSIDAHRLTVIAADGYFVQPVETDFVIVHTGERYDVIVTANQTDQSDYWIRAHTLELEFDNGPAASAPFPLLPHEVQAILHYSGSDPPTPLEYGDIQSHLKNCSNTSVCTAVNCPFQNFHPTYNIDCVNVRDLRLLYPTPDRELPSNKPDVEFIFNFAFENPERTSTINGRNFIFPSAALQTQTKELDRDKEKLKCNLEDTCEDGCHCLHMHEIPYNKTVRFVISTVGNSMFRRRFTHPVHLHGHSFHVVEIGYGTYNDTTGEIIQSTDDLKCSNGSTGAFCVKPQWKNESELNFTITDRTVRKDTVMVPAGGYVVMQFISDNPGFWFLHCHIEPHQLEGMALVINEAQAQQNPPPDGMRSCGNFTWTVEEFNRKEKFNPEQSSQSSNSFEVWKISVIAVGGFLAVVIFVIFTACLLRKYRNRRRGSYSTVPNDTST